MLTRIRSFLAAPNYDDEDRARVARLLNVVLLALFAAMVLVVVAILTFVGWPSTVEDAFTLVGGGVVALATGGLMFAARRGHLRAASVVLLSLIWIIITAWIYTNAGISSDTSPLGYPIIIVLAGLLLGGQAAVVFTVLTGLAVLGAYFTETSGLLVVPARQLTVMDPVLMVVQLGLIGLLLRHAINSLAQALERARDNERAQLEANRTLEALRGSLEERVARRTLDLERRTSQLQAAADVSRAATSILETEQLIWQVATLIYERFGLYHVGIFRLDTTGQWAEYRAGAGEGGLALAEQGFRLEVGGQSLVGKCTASAQPSVIQDVTAGIVRYDHPMVPKTRSEAALPLIARGQVIGALSVQSDQPGTFDPDTMAILQTIADQIAVSMDNVRLFTESQQALEAARRAYGEMTREAWAELLRSRTAWGYTFAHQALAPAQGEWQPEMAQAMQTGQIVQGNSSGEPMIAIPVKVRDETVGALGFFKNIPGGEQTDAQAPGWTDAETELLERMVQQMSLALESAQFYEETQIRAVRERTAREVAARMRETLDVETVLRTAAQSVRQALDLPEVVVRLASRPPGGDQDDARRGPTLPPAMAGL